ncbi:MAG: hypothetical protein NDJ89_07085 [Oligoflexia bacterium]|nr:hypothetical protein [Oligoflexia bacterium]
MKMAAASFFLIFSLNLSVSLTAQAEALRDFAGSFALIEAVPELSVKAPQPIPCSKSLRITEGTATTGDELFVDEWNDPQQPHQTLFKLGRLQLTENTFAQTTRTGNTLTRTIFQQTFFHPKGREVSATYIAALDTAALPSDGIALYLERSQGGHVLATCFYKRSLN